jgi:PAS domain S-box-containing protein
MENNNEDTMNDVKNNTVSHLKIHTDEVNEFIEDKSILDILEFVKQSYPFTFIGRQKFRRKIDKLDFDFWVKNEKIVIVNAAFAKSINLKISGIEGKTLSDLYNLPDYHLVKNITDYIISTSNSVIYETFSKESVNDLIQVVEFPICDIDDNVVAIIGFKQNTFKLEKLISDNNSKLSINLDEIPSVLVSVSKNFEIIDFSNRFYKEFNLNPTSIQRQNLQAIFNLDFAKLLLKESGAIIKIGKSEYHFEYKNINDNPEEGYYFSFIKIIEKNSKNLSSEKTFDMVMYTSPDPMFIYSIDNLRFLKANEAALKFYGYREEELLGMDLTDLYAPEDIQTLVESATRNTIERGYTGPWRQKRKDGSTLEVEISKSGIDYDGERAHLNIVREISQSAESDRIVDQFNLLFENTSDIIIITDADGFIQKTNKSAYGKLGYDSISLSERPFLSLVMDDFRAKVNTSIFHSAVPQKVNCTCELKKNNGSALRAEVIATPLFGTNNEVKSFSIIAKVEQEVVVKTIVQEGFSDAVPATKSKEDFDPDFLRHFFHELLTPVNVIIGFSQELAENAEGSNDEAKEAADIIMQNQRILLQLMNNAVQYTELEQKKINFKPANVHFVELIDQIETDIKKVALNLEKEFSYGKISSSLNFETDESKLQVLTTLLVEFAMRVTKKDKVFLSAYQIDDQYCVVSVKDGRNDISKEFVDGMVEIFTGNENNARHKYGISRFMIRFALKLSDLMAENVGLIPKTGNASEFGFTFPLKFNKKKVEEILAKDESSSIKKEVESPNVTKDEVANEKVETTEEITQPDSQLNIEEKPAATEPTPIIDGDALIGEKVETLEEEKAVKFENLSCLYVEDQIDSQILFKVQMQDLKSVEFANSFEKAIPLLKSNKYDFIIMDINLQGEYNGLDALRAIQKMPEYVDVPIVAVTAYVLPGDRERFISAGFNDFISKPILHEKLEIVLNNIF